MEGKGKGEVPDKPDEAFSCGVLFCFQLVEDEVLQSFGLGWGGKLSVSYFLVYFRPSCRYTNVGREATLTLPSMSLFTGVNATEPSTSADCQI
jgi:hypothetical protein